MMYVALTVSSPRSGFNMYLTPEAVDQVREHFKLPEIFFLLPLEPLFGETTNGHGTIRVNFEITKRAGASGRQLTRHGKLSRVAVPPVSEGLRKRGVPDFGMAPAKLWLWKDVETPRATLEFDPSLSSAPIERHRTVRDPSTVPASAPPPPLVPTSEVVLSLGSRTVAFRVPMEEAFATVLDWTERGYKQQQ